LNKSIDTLVEDIYALFLNGPHEAKDENVEALAKGVAQVVRDRLAAPPRAPTLRLSNLGTPCERKLWYGINTPELAEPLSAPAKIKFLFGDILEQLLVFFVKEAGHKIEGMQDELVINGVVGHRDGIVDGRVVDFKSASTYSFKKFDQGNALWGDDAFGYLTQLGSYHAASKEDDRVTDKERASFIVIDKTLGKICIDTYKLKADVYKLADKKKEVIKSNVPPKREFTDEPEGKSGNRKLGMNCSYCDFKASCWPGLKTYAYSYGPVYLTKVEREPKVQEITDE
jgi:hypothetical protein